MNNAESLLRMQLLFLKGYQILWGVRIGIPFLFAIREFIAIDKLGFTYSVVAICLLLLPNYTSKISPIDELIISTSKKFFLLPCDNIFNYSICYNTNRFGYI